MLSGLKNRVEIVEMPRKSNIKDHLSKTDLIMSPRRANDSDDSDMEDSPISPAVPDLPPPVAALNASLAALVDKSLNGDRVSLPPDILESIMGYSGHESGSTQPVLTFSFTFGRRKLFGSVKSFTAEPGTFHLSKFLADSLGCTDGDTVEVARVALPKAKAVTLRPLESGYSTQQGGDLRSVLEQFLRSNFATLTLNEMLTVDAFGSDHQRHELKFIIEGITPSTAGGVLIIDVDVDLTIETSLDGAPGQQQGKGKNVVTPAKDGPIVLTLSDIAGGTKFGETHASQGPGASRTFEVALSGFETPWKLVVDLTMESEGDSELYATTLRSIPTRTSHYYYDVAPGDKSITVRSSGAVSGDPPSQLTVSVFTYGEQPITYRLSATLGKDSGDVVMSNAAPGSTSEPETPAPGTKQCSNCLQYVPERSLIMHENFCLRNNKRCDRCGKVLLAKDWPSHWHCEACDFSGTTEQGTKHVELEHTRFECACGRALFLKEIGEHQRTECPERVIVCNYCHLLVKAGPNIRSGLDLISEHEDSCRSRTIECVKCGAKVKISLVQSHMKIHEMERRSRPPLVLCSNVNCDKTPSTNPLKLCSTCFTPFYSPNHDPGNKKLIQRVGSRRRKGDTFSNVDSSLFLSPPAS